MLTLPEDVLFILHTLWSNHHEAYVVGGCVRDSLRHVAPKDWDIATSAIPSVVKALFAHTVDTGVKHGTITVVRNRRHYEVTTYRIDGEYLDSRHPASVTFTANIADDLSRRDFTMNAIAYHPEKNFVDPFGGRVDIEKKTIRCVGKPEDRFNEDALRMLRAVRFAAQLGFTIAPETLCAVKPLSYKLAAVSNERIREELTKLLAAPYPEAILLAETTGLMRHILRGHKYGGDLNKTAAWLRYCPKQAAMLFTLFLYWSGDKAEAIMRDLRFDNKTIKETALYVKWLPVKLPEDRYAVKKALNQVRPAFFFNLLTLKNITAAPFESERQETTGCGRFAAIYETAADIITKGECFTLGDLSVNGTDLINAGVKQGKPTGLMLEKLLDAVMRDPSLNDKNTLMTLAAHWLI